jgi:hypothetical protein
MVQIASKSHAIVFSKAGKTILDPSMRTVHTPPELNQWSPIPAYRGRLSGYWIGGLPVYQAGGPPLGFEKTGLSSFGLRGDVSGTCVAGRT